MNVVIIGGVAAGTKAAAKLLRKDRSLDVTIYTKGSEISYAGCGLPYYVGGSIESREELIVNTPAKFSGLTGTKVVTEAEATGLDAGAKTVTIRRNGQEEHVPYDRLILAVGAQPFVPEVPGVELPGVFTMRTPGDAVGLREYVETNRCRNAVVVGGGFIGLEIAENLMAKGLNVTVIDMADQVMPNIFDPEMADFIRKNLQSKGMRIRTATAFQGVTGDGRVQGVLTSGGSVSADVAVLAIGIRPATGFLESSGLEMVKGAICVDEAMKTNLPDVYAVGDCALVRNRITGKQQWSAMGSTANISARSLAAGTPYPGCMGTGVVRLADDLNAGRTGLTEAQARDAGYDVETALCVLDDKPHYYPGSASFTIKLLADRASRRLLGIQVLGAGAVDKLVDIAVTGIAMNARLDDFNTLDYAYAPPFSTAIHPFVQACYVLENKLDGILESFTPAQYAAGMAKGYKVIDVKPEPGIPGAPWVDLARFDGTIEGVDKDDKLLLVCNRGRRGYLLQNRMKAAGYTNTKVLEGGTFFNNVKVTVPGGKLDPAEIKRVKGLGCLQDKRFPDVFNVRVITRNGKITAEEQKAIAEASELFGSSAVTMTTRLTLEIQGVKYENLQPLMDFLHDRGLETGGTGSLVRPVVSCKGTTCQYGLYDTYALSEEIHNRFYKGFSDVSLPHKFKIAVGGCPNNCVKPDLNDLGIVGARVPGYDPEKCKGCKKCQLETACPIHAAKLVEGKLVIDPNLCNSCGRCVGKCPFHCNDQGDYGWKVYVGGRWGKRVAHGRMLDKVFTDKAEVLDVVEKAILLFRDQGKSGERFADTIERIGFENAQAQLLGDELLERKKEILGLNVVGGASC